MRERVSIVNDQDEEIAVKYRDELTREDIHRIVSIWVENDAEEVLLAQRALHKKLHPGLWGPAAAGAVSYGETYEEAAHKELSEEIGITDVTLKLVTKTLFKIGDEYRYISWFKVILNKPADQFRLESEVAQVQWFKKTDLKDHIISSPEIFVPSHVLWSKLKLM